ncbi:hypothetical protein [Streptococcus dentiloxodontae]
MPPRPPFNGYRPPYSSRSGAGFGLGSGLALGCGGVIAGLVLLVIFAAVVIQYLLPILLIVGVGYGIYYLATRKTGLQRKNISQRLQDLKDSIQQADRQVKLMDNYLDEKDYTNYAILGRQLLPKLKDIRYEADALKSNMDLQIYKRVTKKANEVTADIEAQLTKLDITVGSPASDEEKEILKRAPEIAQSYQNIQRDHMEILGKLEKADNQAELEALHEINMNRFKDILVGYLQIKKSPKDYYNAEERLSQAKKAIEQFDKDLDETLRKLNENQLSDFEISLRMMQEKSKL